METEIWEERFEEKEVYVLKRMNTVTQYIATQPNMELCEVTVQMMGMWVAKR